MRLTPARAHYLKSDFRQVLEILETVLDSAEPHGWVPQVANALSMRGNALWSLKRRREAFAVVRGAMEVAQENGLAEIHLRLMGTLSNAATETDQAASYASWREAIALARKMGQRGLLMSGIGNLGYSGFLAGEWDESLAEIEAVLVDDVPPNSRLVLINNYLIMRASRGEPIDDGLAEMKQLGSAMSGRWQTFLADPIANEALARGELKKARDNFFNMYEQDPGNAEYAFRAARPALWARDLADAQMLLRSVEESGAYGPVHDARLASIRGGIAALEGRGQEALALYRDALRGWRETHSVWDEALTGIEMALLLDPTEADVAAAINSSRVILERLRAKPYLERLETAAAARPGGRAPATRPASIQAEAALSE
jgi:tetratricopeptide (TPR) repeat protein